jgi:hypothetical protein
MSRIISLLLVFCIAAGLSCQPTKVAPSSLTGKLVIDGPCGNYVIQVLQGNPPRGRVAASWKDTLSNMVYTNVFTVSNRCHFPDPGTTLSKGDVFTFEWDGNPPANNCMTCQIYVPTPAVENAVKNIQKIK